MYFAQLRNTYNWRRMIIPLDVIKSGPEIAENGISESPISKFSG